MDELLQFFFFVLKSVLLAGIFIWVIRSIFQMNGGQTPEGVTVTHLNESFKITKKQFEESSF